jgi:hypothetical protein
MIFCRITILTLLLFLSTVIVAQPSRLVIEEIAEVNLPILVLSATDNVDDDRLYIVGHDGRIWIYEDGEVLEEPFLDLSEEGLNILNFGVNSEQGINGVVFSPDYESSGLLYVTYTGTTPDGEGDPIEQRLVCFKRDENNPLIVDTSQWYQILEFDEGDEPELGHNGGQLIFRNGHLFISTGDGGSTGNGQQGGGSGGDDHGEIGNGQNLKTLLGKVLRIDVHGMAPYTIPADNPFVGDTAAFDEIWSYGFRNPWRFSFDKITGDMFIGDVGEVDWEEIDYEPANSPGGLNYGWRLMEGDVCYEPIVDCDTDDVLVDPIHVYPHDSGWCATVGGYMYRGQNIPSLYGHYIFSDFCSYGDVDVWTLTNDNGNWIVKPLELISENPFFWNDNRFGFGEDNKGELYYCTRFYVYKFVEDPDYEPLPKPEELIVFPNPTQGAFTIDLLDAVSIDQIQLWDALGRVVWDAELNNVYRTAQISVKGLPIGVYTLKVVCSGFTEERTTRLVIHPEIVD